MDPTHRCPACNLDKPLNQFYGGSGRCKPCKSLYYKNLRYGRERPEGRVVYVVQEGEDGPFKIGMTRNLRQRLTALQSSTWRALHFRGATHDADEKTAHLDLHEWRIRGEWFKNCPEVVVYIESMLGELVRESLK